MVQRNNHTRAMFVLQAETRKEKRREVQRAHGTDKYLFVDCANSYQSFQRNGAKARRIRLHVVRSPPKTLAVLLEKVLPPKYRVAPVRNTAPCHMRGEIGGKQQDGAVMIGMYELDIGDGCSHHSEPGFGVLEKQGICLLADA